MKPSIDWGIPNLRQINPVKGCKRNCVWNGTPCYAKTFWNRLLRAKYHHEFDDPHFYPHVLKQIRDNKTPTTYFFSMSDPEYYEKGWMVKILDTCQFCYWHTFMFLSKNPIAYGGYNWPANCMQGLTLTCEQSEQRQIVLVNIISEFPRPFLSLEPLLGMFLAVMYDNIERVVVGPLTVNGRAKYDEHWPEWVESVKRNVPAGKSYWKGSGK